MKVQPSSLDSNADSDLRGHFSLLYLAMFGRGCRKFSGAALPCLYNEE